MVFGTEQKTTENVMSEKSLDFQRGWWNVKRSQELRIRLESNRVALEHMKDLEEYGL